MITLIEHYSSLLIEGYKVRLLMSGTYENFKKLEDSPTITFLYRCPKIYLTPLSIELISLSYQKLFNIKESKALNLAKLTKGYPYAYNLLINLLNKYNKKDIDNELLNYFDNYLKNIYDEIYLKLSKNEINILKLFNSDKKTKIPAIFNKTSLNYKDFKILIDHLIKKGILIYKSYQTLEFALPRFYEYLRQFN